MEIRSIEIDIDKGILKINGEEFTERPVMVILPGPDGWSLKRILNTDLGAGECDRLEVSYCSRGGMGSGCYTEIE
ncbi:MAG: hypothetical protein UDG86_08290 [Lachnospiraceae bacterium]|nr:hypothetical protein [Lachnospiraceae bacterium]